MFIQILSLETPGVYMKKRVNDYRQERSRNEKILILNTNYSFLLSKSYSRNGVHYLFLTLHLLYWIFSLNKIF